VITALNAATNFVQKAITQETSDSPCVKPPEVPPMSVSFAEVRITLRNLRIDLGSITAPTPFQIRIPCIQSNLMMPSATDLAKLARIRGVPAVPPWHCMAPVCGDGCIDPDFGFCRCVCGGLSTVVNPADCMKSKSGCHNSFVTERQWRPASGPAPTVVVVPTDELLMLSNAKLRVLEQASEWDALGEAWVASATQAIARETERRVPLVEELMEESSDGLGSGPLQAQLQALQLEVQSIEDERQEDQLRLRTCEREAAAAVAVVCAEQYRREEELRRQLEVEQRVTGALAQLVEEQALMIAHLYNKQVETANCHFTG